MAEHTPTPKHTPAPWRYNEDVDQSDPLIRTEDGAVVLGFEVGGWGEESHWLVEDADGRLMASAPDLLAALERCAADLEAELEHRYRGGLKDYPSLRADFEADMEPVRAAHAALARARGEPEGTTHE